MAAEKNGMSERDTTLINILDRMIGQLQRQDTLLDDLVKRQEEFSKAMESVEFRQETLLDDLMQRQEEFSKAMESVQFSRESMQAETGAGFDRLRDALSRYRSDMLSLVNEQDHINKKMDDMNALVNKTAYAMGNADQKLTDLSERIKIQEKAIGANYEHSLKQAETAQIKFDETNRNIVKLHADEEKHLGEMHRETQRQLEKTQQETSRRLLALDSIEDALRTLLARTEPPAKKPFWIVRQVKKIGGFCRIRLPLMVRRLRKRRKW